MVTRYEGYEPGNVLVRPDDVPTYPNDVDSTLDFSFSAQIERVMNNPGMISASLQTPPDMFAVTLSSAVPLADSITSFYDTMEREVPPIMSVNAKRGNALLHFRYVRERTEEMWRDNESHWTDDEKKYVDELAPIVDGLEHVCVMDEYTSTGSTALYAAQLLLAAGAKRATAVRGVWYSHTFETEVDAKNLTSVHADFMRSVGRDAAKTFVA